jgi:hypothetical protein
MLSRLLRKKEKPKEKPKEIYAKVHSKCKEFPNATQRDEYINKEDPEKNILVFISLGLGCEGYTKEFIQKNFFPGVHLENIIIHCRSNVVALKTIKNLYSVSNLLNFEVKPDYVDQYVTSIIENSKIYNKIFVFGFSFGGAIINKVAEKLNSRLYGGVLYSEAERQAISNKIYMAAFGSIYIPRDGGLVSQININIINYMAVGDVACKLNKMNLDDVFKSDNTVDPLRACPESGDAGAWSLQKTPKESIFQLTKDPICKFRKLNDKIIAICFYLDGEYSCNYPPLLAILNSLNELKKWRIHNNYSLIFLKLLANKINNLDKIINPQNYVEQVSTIPLPVKSNNTKYRTLNIPIAVKVNNRKMQESPLVINSSSVKLSNINSSGKILLVNNNTSAKLKKESSKVTAVPVNNNVSTVQLQQKLQKIKAVSVNNNLSKLTPVIITNVERKPNQGVQKILDLASITLEYEGEKLHLINDQKFITKIIVIDTEFDYKIKPHSYKLVSSRLVEDLNKRYQLKKIHFIEFDKKKQFIAYNPLYINKSNSIESKNDSININQFLDEYKDIIKALKNKNNLIKANDKKKANELVDPDLSELVANKSPKEKLRIQQSFHNFEIVREHDLQLTKEQKLNKQYKRNLIKEFKKFIKSPEEYTLQGQTIPMSFNTSKYPMGSFVS